MNRNTSYLVIVILVLLIGCQQTYTEEANPISVSEPIVKEEKTVIKDIAKNEALNQKINNVDDEKTVENVYTGIIMNAMNRNYQIRAEGNLAPLRFTGENGQFKVLDKVQFKVNSDGQVYDISLFKREEYIGNFKDMSKDYSGDDVVTRGTAVVTGVDYGRYSALDEATRKRLLINLPGLNLFMGDKIDYMMDRNGHIVDVKVIN